MKVKGEPTFQYEILGKQKFDEATVSKKGSNSLFAKLFGHSQKVTIDAGKGDDTIDVKKLGPNQYSVKINGQEFILSKAEMKNLTIKGGSGNDKINIDKSVDVPITVDGGTGNDTIKNEANFATLKGGAGDDTIVSASMFAKIVGGSGNDKIDVEGHFNQIWGSDQPDLWELLFGMGNEENDTINSKGVNIHHD